MKKFFFRILLGSMLGFITTSFCTERQHEAISEYKFSISLSELQFSDNGMIWVASNGGEIPVHKLLFEDGQYFAFSLSDFFGVWWCYDCQSWNSKYDIACPRCGMPGPNAEIDISEDPLLS